MADRGVLDALIDQLFAVIENRNNRTGTRSRKPGTASFFVTLEEPIAWTILEGLDVNRYFQDTYYWAEQSLKHKLWRSRHVDDCTAVTTDLPLWLGHYPEYTFFNLDVIYNARGVPAIREDHPLRSRPDISLLQPVDFESSGIMPKALHLYEELQNLVGGKLKVDLLTWWRGCLDLAVQLRGYDNLVADTVERPSFVKELLGFITDQRNRWHQSRWSFLGRQREPAEIGDDWVNIPFISPQMFEEFVLPCYLEIERWHGGVRYVHSCGNQTGLQKHLLKIESLEFLEVSAWSDLDQSLRNIPPHTRLLIQLHPNDVLYASPEQIERQLRFIAERCEGRSYDVSTSGLTPVTNSTRDFIEAIRRFTDVAHGIWCG